MTQIKSRAIAVQREFELLIESAENTERAIPKIAADIETAAERIDAARLRYQQAIEQASRRFDNEIQDAIKSTHGKVTGYARAIGLTRLESSTAEITSIAQHISPQGPVMPDRPRIVHKEEAK